MVALRAARVGNDQIAGTGNVADSGISDSEIMRGLRPWRVERSDAKSSRRDATACE
jgi:hypothetical protein